MTLEEPPNLELQSSQFHIFSFLAHKDFAEAFSSVEPTDGPSMVADRPKCW